MVKNIFMDITVDTTVDTYIRNTALVQGQVYTCIIPRDTCIYMYKYKHWPRNLVVMDSNLIQGNSIEFFQTLSTCTLGLVPR